MGKFKRHQRTPWPEVMVWATIPKWNCVSLLNCCNSSTWKWKHLIFNRKILFPSAQDDKPNSTIPRFTQAFRCLPLTYDSHWHEGYNFFLGFSTLVFVTYRSYRASKFGRTHRMLMLVAENGAVFPPNWWQVGPGKWWIWRWNYFMGTLFWDNPCSDCGIVGVFPSREVGWWLTFDIPNTFLMVQLLPSWLLLDILISDL